MPELSQKNQTILNKLQSWQSESKDTREHKDHRWAKNLKLIKGIFRDNDAPKSVIRGRDKTFFRKIWATIWRLTATMYQAFMKDTETFRIVGRDLIDDPHQAEVLQKMVKYREDKMYSNDSLFLKLIWAIQNIFTYGWCCAKLTWEFNEKTGVDGPKFILYPPEQVFPDMVAETKDTMRYIHFLNYMTEEEMEENGYDTEFMSATAPESNEIRDVRFDDDKDPMININDNTSYSTPFGGTYPTPGSAPDTEKDKHVARHKVYESFWIDDGVLMYAVSLDFQDFLKKPESSIYLKMPIIMGQCLTEMNKLLGEGFPEPLEGPQESFNYNLNMRKDNVALAMTGHTFVGRNGGVDMQSLVKRRTSGITVMDDVNQVKHEQMPDVTRSAYVEASHDEGMMDEMSGVTPTIGGQDTADKATTSSINLQQSNVKIDLYVALVGQTLFKDFHQELARQIQLFESDEIVFRVANEALRRDNEDFRKQDRSIFNIDFDADAIVDVGPGTVGQNVHVQQTLMAMDRGIMTLQAVAQLAQLGAIPEGGIKLPNIAAFFEDLLPRIGHKDLRKYFITIPPPQNDQGGGGVSPAGNSPQQNASMVQNGSLGGV